MNIFKIRLFTWLCLLVFTIFIGISRHISSLPVSGRLILRENRGDMLGKGVGGASSFLKIGGIRGICIISAAKET